MLHSYLLQGSKSFLCCLSSVSFSTYPSPCQLNTFLILALKPFFLNRTWVPSYLGAFVNAAPLSATHEKSPRRSQYRKGTQRNEGIEITVPWCHCTAQVLTENIKQTQPTTEASKRGAVGEQPAAREGISKQGNSKHGSRLALNVAGKEKCSSLGVSSS